MHLFYKISIWYDKKNRKIIFDTETFDCNYRGQIFRVVIDQVCTDLEHLDGGIECLIQVKTCAIDTGNECRIGKLFKIKVIDMWEYLFHAIE